MDIGSVIGLVVAVGAILGAILSAGDLGAFIDIPSVIVVGMGVIGVTLVKWPLETVLGLTKFGTKVFFGTSANPKSTIDEVCSLAETARRESVFALEKVPIDDIFLKKACTLAADNRPPEVISAVLQLEIDSMEERHKLGIDVLSNMKDDGPAMGMIGTLIGLVIMLGNLSDQAAIGPAMAVALLTTFYGAIIANVFCGPFANKLKFRSNEESVKMNIIIAGVLGIVAGENPRLIREKLNSFLAPAQRKTDECEGGE